MFHEMEGKTVSPPDMIVGCESALVDRDSRICTFANNMSVSGCQPSVGNESFGQLSFPVMTGMQLSMGDGVCDKACGVRTLDQMMFISSAFSGDANSNSRLVSSMVDEHRRADDASLVDLKLGRFPDRRHLCNSSLSRGTLLVSSSETSNPPKRAGAGGASSQTPHCQVYGCNKDLSSSKGYHKRHKVCEVHSKTSKVIVNGIQQRFCQQCSRFQLLSEFDDGKRSCRKRLADHNERRRKPQVGIHSGQTGRVLHSYNGGLSQGSAFSTASFVSEDLHPGALLHSDKYGKNDFCRQIKVEDGTNYCSLSEIQNIHGCLDSKSIFSYGHEKQFSDNGAKTAMGCILSDSSSQYQEDLRSPNSGSLSLFRETSLENDEYNIFDTASTRLGLSGIPDSGCAPSLLSSLSRNSSSHSSGIPVVLSLVKLDSNHSMMDGVSEKLVGVSSQASFNGLSNNPPSSALTPKYRTDISPILVSDSNEVNFQIANEIGQSSEFTDSKHSLSCEDSPTIDLLQFSSPHERVEHRSSLGWGSSKLIPYSPCESLDVIGLQTGSKGCSTKHFRRI